MKYTGFVAMGRKDPKSRILTFFFYKSFAQQPAFPCFHSFKNIPDKKSL